MLYPVYVHMGNDKEAHSVTFPDFPGCFSAADEWSALPAAIQEAVEAHFYAESEVIPPPTALEHLIQLPDYVGGVWMLVDIDLSRLNTQPMRLNISLPSNLVQQIDAYANAHHMTRSGFLAKAAQQAMHT